MASHQLSLIGQNMPLPASMENVNAFPEKLLCGYYLYYLLKKITRAFSEVGALNYTLRCITCMHACRSIYADDKKLNMYE